MSKAKYTPLDRAAVNLWVAKSALETVRRMLKAPEKQQEMDTLLAIIQSFRGRLISRDLEAKW